MKDINLIKELAAEALPCDCDFPNGDQHRLHCQSHRRPVVEAAMRKLAEANEQRIAELLRCAERLEQEKSKLAREIVEELAGVLCPRCHSLSVQKAWVRNDGLWVHFQDGNDFILCWAQHLRERAREKGWI